MYFLLDKGAITFKQSLLYALIYCKYLNFDIFYGCTGYVKRSLLFYSSICLKTTHFALYVNLMNEIMV